MPSRDRWEVQKPHCSNITLSILRKFGSKWDTGSMFTTDVGINTVILLFNFIT